jgi:hypothetical protein
VVKGGELKFALNSAAKLPNQPISLLGPHGRATPIPTNYVLVFVNNIGGLTMLLSFVDIQG